MKKKDMKKKVVSHLKDDIETFHEEASEDKKLIKSMKKDTCKVKSKMKKKKK